MKLTFIKDKLQAMNLEQLREQWDLVSIYYSQLGRGWMNGKTSDKQMARCFEMKKYIEKLIKIATPTNLSEIGF